MREVVVCNPGFNETPIDSMQQVLCTLARHFSSMEVKGEPVQVTQACTEMDMKRFWEQIFNLICHTRTLTRKVFSEPQMNISSSL